MARFVVEVDVRKMQQLANELPGKLSEALHAVSEEVTGDIVLSFGVSPSAEGQPPGVDTGALRASMRWEPESELSTVVMDGVEYGIYLEGGTERMAARPFIVPVFLQYQRGKFARFMAVWGLA